MIKMILVLQYTTLDPRSPYDTNAINAVWHYPYLFGGSGLKFLDPRIQKLGWVRDLQFISGLRRGHLRSLTILLAVYTRSLYSVFWAQAGAINTRLNPKGHPATLCQFTYLAGLYTSELQQGCKGLS